MNQIKRITREEYVSIVDRFYQDMVIQVDGKKCTTLEDYFWFIYRRLNFPPDTIRPNYDGYADWMRDMSYFPYDKVHFIILNYSLFLSEEDITAKEKIMKGFEKTILPWWEEDVLHCCVGGKVKEFNVYLLD